MAVVMGMPPADREATFNRVLELTRSGAHGEVVDLCSGLEGPIAADAGILSLWGMACFHLERIAAAAELFQRALDAAPEDRQIRHNLSVALARGGRAEEAVAMFATCAAPWDGGAEDSLPVPTLDAISEDYDGNPLHQYFSQRLLGLHQGAFPGRRLRRVLELGVGTGLLGTRLPASATTVTGIELSPAMIAQARERKIYDQLIEGRLPGVLETLDGPFESILSSCVMCYFADLEPFFRHAARLLTADGAFLFSVDPLDDAGEIGVTGPGEYAHSRPYLRRVAEANGFRTVAMEIDVHRGAPGFWCAFKKG